MKRILSTVVFAGVLLAGTSSAAGQSLSERIAEIRAEQAAARASKTRLTEKGRILQALLYGKVTTSFQDAPARDVFKYLATALDITIIVRSQEDAVGHGIDLDQFVTLDVIDMPALEALEMVLEQCSVLEPCTWQLRKSFLEVGTKARLSSPAARTVEVYPIDDLLFDIPRFTDAPDQRLDGQYLDDARYGRYGGWPGRYHPGLRGGRYGGGTIGGGPYGGGAGGSISTTRSGPDRAPTKEEKAQEIIDSIVMAIEPEAWTVNGGEWASIRYHDGALIVSAPDYIQRQIGGYPKVPPPAPPQPATP